MLQRWILFSAFFILLGTSFTASAKFSETGIDQFTLVGFDAEMGERSFSWLIPHLDKANLANLIESRGLRVTTMIHPGFFEDLHLNAQILAGLPEDMRNTLTEGLNLSPPRILTSSESAPVENRTRSGLILPPGFGATDWPILQRRWQALTPLEKATALKIETLSDTKIAAILMNLPGDVKDVHTLYLYLKFNSEAPAWLQRLDFTLDGPNGSRAIEIALRGENGTEDKNEAFNVSEALLKETKLAQIYRGAHQQVFVDSSYHLHIGLTDDAPDSLVEDLPRILQDYKRLTLIRMMSGGTQNDSVITPFKLVTGHSLRQIAYEKHSLGDRSLVRRVDNRHVEIRQLTQSPRATYIEFRQLLAMGYEAANQWMKIQMQNILTSDPSIVKRITDLNPGVLLDFSDVLGMPTALEKISARIQEPDAEPILASLIRFAEQNHAGLQIAQLILSLNNPHLKSARMEHLMFLGQRHPAIKEFIINHFSKNPGDLMLAEHLRYSERFEQGPDLRIEMLLTATSANRRAEILHSLYIDFGNHWWDPNPDRLRLSQVIKQIYHNQENAQEDFLLARLLYFYFKTDSQRNLSCKNALELARQNIWSTKPDMALAAYRLLDDRNKIPEDVREYWHTRDISENMDKPVKVAQLLKTYYKDEPGSESRKWFEESFRHMVKLGGPPPETIMVQIREAKATRLHEIVCEFSLSSAEATAAAIKI